MEAGRNMIRMHYCFRGRVQGVGFRYTAYYAAKHLGLTGFVENEYDGSVTMEVQGPAADIEEMLRMIRDSRWIHIDSSSPRKIKTVEGERSFRVKGY